MDKEIDRSISIGGNARNEQGQIIIQRAAFYSLFPGSSVFHAEIKTILYAFQTGLVDFSLPIFAQK